MQKTKFDVVLKIYGAENQDQARGQLPPCLLVNKCDSFDSYTEAKNRADDLYLNYRTFFTFTVVSSRKEGIAWRLWRKLRNALR